MTLQVLELAHRDDNDADHRPFNTFAESNGSVRSLWYVDEDNLGRVLVLTASGSSSGLKAVTVFTDTFGPTVVDDRGADDLPDQKDLNSLATDKGGLPTTLGIMWNWDDTQWTGGNTGDACALFDTTNDRFANFALCATVDGDPATQVEKSPRVYSCNNTKADRCAGDTLVKDNDTTTTTIPVPASTCVTAITVSDPFAGVTNDPISGKDHTSNNACGGTIQDCQTKDTVATCPVA